MVDQRFESLLVSPSPAVRRAIASRYLGAQDGDRFATERKPNGTLVRLSLDNARVWDLSGILPADM